MIYICYIYFYSIFNRNTNTRLVKASRGLAAGKTQSKQQQQKIKKKKERK